MNITLKKLTSRDGLDIYKMLSEMPAEENGFVNRVALSNGGYAAKEADGRVYISIKTGRGADH